MVAAESLDAAQDILNRYTGRGQDHLASLESYVKVIHRCRADMEAVGEKSPPSVQWFLSPLEYATAQREIDPQFMKSEKIDMLRVFHNTGFGAIRGVGSLVHLDIDGYDVLQRGAAYAPPPYEKSMLSLAISNAPPQPPLDWIPADVTEHIDIHWDLQKAVDNFGPLFDETVGEGDEGLWEETLQSILDDKRGPQIDLKKSLFAHLGERAVIVADVQQPVAVDSERRMLIAELKDPNAVLATLNKYYAKDDTATKKMAGDFTYWEFEPEEEPKARAAGAAPAARSALAVAHKHLLWASHSSMLIRFLQPPANLKVLADHSQYQLVSKQIAAEMQKRNWEEICAQRHFLTREGFQTAFELARRGELEKSDMPLGRLLSNWLEGNSRRKFDGSKLPEFGKVQHYLQPAGSLGIREDSDTFAGWFGIDFTLKPAE
jgi:hypothetical protein